MGDLNKKNIINKAEKILEKCEEKYINESKNKKRLRELERQYKKVKKINIALKIILALTVMIAFIIVI